MYFERKKLYLVPCEKKQYIYVRSGVLSPRIIIYINYIRM